MSIMSSKDLEGPWVTVAIDQLESKLDEWKFNEQRDDQCSRQISCKEGTTSYLIAYPYSPNRNELEDD